MFWNYSSFWKTTVITLAIIVVIFIIIGLVWRKVAKNGITLSAEAFRSPINASLTVASIIIPLLLTLLSYLIISQSIDPKKLTVIGASLVVFILSILAGLWNIFGLATVTNDEGKIKIDKNTNVFVPSQVTSQFFLILAGFVLLLLFDFSLVKPKEKVEKEKPLPEYSFNTIYLRKTKMEIQIPECEVLRLWGAPIKTNKTDSTKLLYYETPVSTIELKLQKRKIQQIKETAK